jgi:hydrogenase maturation protein HypF
MAPVVARATPGSQRRLRFTVTGVVQGVGFRPFVHRLATDLHLTGFVGNDAGSVFIEVQGDDAALSRFETGLTRQAPALAEVAEVQVSVLPPVTTDPGFAIVASRGGDAQRTFVPPDVATCDACLADLADPANRRYRHPFVTCTDCGPRLSIITDLPYDRPATTMAQFPMCPACAREYADPADRRFHAQPIACRDCGPVLRFGHGGTTTLGSDAALAAAQRALAAGLIVAVKGLGGFHLACRADDAAAVAALRGRKARDEKPFALMVRDLTVARTLVDVDAAAERVLTSPARPIVLLPRRARGAGANDAVCAAVAPGNPLLGLLLPYTPLHHLLMSPVPGADVTPPDRLVLTSANISDEPLCFDDVDAATRLPRLADAVLTHDRPIHVPVDDSVVRVVRGQELPIRRSRGYAPLPVSLGRRVPTTLAVGGELKNACCLADGAHAFCSAHIGDMGTVETTRAFERAVGQLVTMHRAEPLVLAADAHPGYLTRAWAERHAGRPGEPRLELVQHHHAHVAALLAEHGRIGEAVIGVAFDGTGYGDDGTIWGGELLLVGPDVTHSRRVGHLAPIPLPGGDAAVRNPCRSALAYLWVADVPWDGDLAPVAACADAELLAVRAQLVSGTATVPCSSMGRFFDAVASLLGVRHRIGYEAQAAIELEHLAATALADPKPVGDRRRVAGRRRVGGRRPDGDRVPALPAFGLEAGDDGALVLDHRPVIRGLADGLRAGVPAPALALATHVAVADAVASATVRLAAGTGVRTIGLTGGVFQNVLLLRLCAEQLVDLDLDVIVHRLVPPNDGGLALGQAVVAASRAGTPAPARGEG